ncbi:MAG: sll0787 family AIR synthase-like protein [Verrucomicrobiota bacterium]
MTAEDLAILARQLEAHPAIAEKATIEAAYAPASQVSQNIQLGDDCAAIPDSNGEHLLFAAEGMLPSFVAEDPWFAGYCAVMVNLSDIAAMGGTPIAITDVLWTPDSAASSEIWDGLQAASRAYNVPVVGGHTTYTGKPETGTHLAAAVLGRAGSQLLTSFHAQPGDHLVMAIDMKASFRKNKPFWNASTDATPEHLQTTLALPRKIAELGISQACKDISNGGIVGTLAMLAHCSNVGATLDLDAIPTPASTPLLKWLSAFPSYGYLFAAKEKDIPNLQQVFRANKINTSSIGRFTDAKQLTLQSGSSREVLKFSNVT